MAKQGPKDAKAEKATKKTTAKKVTAKPAVPKANKPAKAKAKAATETVATPKKDDIVLAYFKHHRVDSASKKGKSVMATHLPHIESKVAENSPLSFEIPFADIKAVYRMLGK